MTRNEIFSLAGDSVGVGGGVASPFTSEALRDGSVAGHTGAGLMPRNRSPRATPSWKATSFNLAGVGTHLACVTPAASEIYIV